MSADEFDFEDYLFGEMKKAQRRVRALEAQLEAAGFDPDEAPLWRRIAEQRKQLHDANVLISHLGMCDIHADSTFGCLTCARKRE